jgi:PAS domain S-box-containing protein
MAESISTPIRVLLIDDDEMAFALTRAILEQIPRTTFSLDCVTTFQEGAEAFRRDAHDVYLVDYQLGADSGIELVRQARAARVRAPMILLTGKGRYEVDVEAMEAGVSDYMEKSSLDPDRVERAIRYALERTRAEAALRDSEARHRGMFDHLPVGLYRTTPDGDLLDANPALVQILGHPDRETLAYDYARNFFVNPSHRQTFLSRLDQFGVLRGFESDLRRPDGSHVRIRNAARSHRDDAGHMLYVEGAVEDVSGEHEARDLHGRAARFTWLFQESGLPILLADLTGIVMDANPAFARTFGYEAEGLRGRPLAELAHPEDHDALEAELRAVAAGAVQVGESQRRLVAADGAPLWARTRTGLVRSAKGHPDHVILLFEDVAEV